MDLTRESKRLSGIIMNVISVYEYYANQSGINGTAMYLLEIVYTSEPCTQKQICEMMRAPKQTINNIVKDYQRKGILETMQMPEDRRHKYICLTQMGREFCKPILLPYAQAQTEALEQFTEEERNTMLSLLEKCNKVYTAKLLQKDTQ